jgi:hypothetical protein
VLRVFENTVLRKIFVPKREEITGDWWQLHNEELHYLHLWRDVIEVIRLRTMRWMDMLHAWNGWRIHTGCGGKS